MKRSIKRRLLINFILIILSMVVILEVLFINTVKDNYYKNLAESMSSQIDLSSDMYLKYYSDKTLEANLLNDVDTFWRDTTAQVQIIDLNGNVTMNSSGSIGKKNLVNQFDDVKKALGGEPASWVGKINYSPDKKDGNDVHKVMAVSKPLNSKEGQVGVIRFITSLKAVDSDITKIIFICLVIGTLTLLLGTIAIIILSKTITDPLNEVTRVAEIMASGNYRVKSKKYYEDEIGKLFDTLHHMAEEILVREEMKNEFISSVSHELRTPLTSIKGWAITIKEFGNDKEMLSDGLEIIEKESDRLTSMVEELLDFSKFVSGKITLNNREVNIEDIVKHIHNQYIPRANRDNVEFIVKYEDMPIMKTDDNRLKQVFINLLDNAFKFTPSGGKVEFSASRRSNYLIFKVSDTGCGIPSEDLPKVKEKFFKGKNSNSKNGIGLSICDEIIALMNGVFEIESTNDEGTTVTVSIPIMEEY